MVLLACLQLDPEQLPPITANVATDCDEDEGGRAAMVTKTAVPKLQSTTLLELSRFLCMFELHLRDKQLQSSTF